MKRSRNRRALCGAVTAAVLLLVFVFPATAHPGIGIVVDGSGNVFYTDLEQVLKIAPDGTRTVAVPNVHTHELFLDRNGDLYGEHLWYEGDATKRFDYRIWRLTAAGRLENVVPPTRGIRTTYSFVRDAAGNMYSARPVDATGAPKLTDDGVGLGSAAPPSLIVVRRSPDGSVTAIAGGGPAGRDGRGPLAGFTDIRWLAASADGTVFAIDNGSLRRIGRDGTVTTLARELGESIAMLAWTRPLHTVMGLAPAPDGSVYVANHGARKLKRVAPDGRVTVALVSPGLWSPTGVALGTGGDLYVLEYTLTGARVRRLSKDGTITVLR